MAEAATRTVSWAAGQSLAADIGEDGVSRCARRTKPAGRLELSGHKVAEQSPATNLSCDNFLAMGCPDPIGRRTRPDARRQARSDCEIEITPGRPTTPGGRLNAGDGTRTRTTHLLQQ